MGKIETKNIQDLLSEYIGSIDNPRRAKIRHWPEIAGERLCKLTMFDRIENGILYISVKESSARSLVMLSRKSIISKFMYFFPDEKIRDIRISRMY